MAGRIAPRRRPSPHTVLTFLSHFCHMAGGVDGAWGGPPSRRRGSHRMTSRQSAHEVRFGPFRLDIQDERLWQGVQALRLRHKSLAVLRYLLARPGRLVTKEELLDGVWPEMAVGEGVLTNCLQELRRALGDDARQPQYIETVHRRGYRFIALVLGADAAPAPAA